MSQFDSLASYENKIVLIETDKMVSSLFLLPVLGGDSAVKLLQKFGLLEYAIDYAAENW